MTVTRNTGADLLPLAARPSYPGARLRALQNARARREREAPPPDEAFTAERLRRDLASVPVDVVLNGKQRDYLRRLGWTDERYARAQADERRSLSRRVHPPSAVDPAVTAAGRIVSGTPAPAVHNLTPTHRRAILGNVAAAKCAGYDPDRFYPGWQEKLLASGSPDRRVPARPGRLEARKPASTGPTTRAPVPRAQGGRRRRAW